MIAFWGIPVRASGVRVFGVKSVKKVGCIDFISVDPAELFISTFIACPPNIVFKVDVLALIVVRVQDVS